MRGPTPGVRRFVSRLLTEGGGPGREAAAIGVGVFIGCLPFYGFHLLICLAFSTLLGLNRLKTYLAANISNPLVAPWLVLAEVQAGAWLRRGSPHELSVQTLETTGAGVIGADLLVGSIAIGGALGALAALVTRALAMHRIDDRPFADLVRRAADRYAGASLTAWQFARVKLRRDPIYRALVCDGLLAGRRASSAARTLVDVGCGQGLALALLSQVRDDVRAGRSPAGRTSPVFDRLVGVEIRPRVAALASAALTGDVTVIAADAAAMAIEPADAILFLDVLHMISLDRQEVLLASVRASLSPDGVILVREADPAGGWRFRMVEAGNRLKALAFGHWRQRFHFRSVTDWQSCFSRLGMQADVQAMGQGTPFANVMFVVTKPSAVIPSSRKTDTSTAGVL